MNSANTWREREEENENDNNLYYAMVFIDSTSNKPPSYQNK